MSLVRIGDHPLMSDVTVHNGVAYLSGQVALGRTDASFEDQTLIVFSRIDELLALAGTDRSRLLNASVWLVDRGDFSAFNALWRDWLKATLPPARATVVSSLVLEGLKVEVQVTAAI